MPPVLAPPSTYRVSPAGDSTALLAGSYSHGRQYFGLYQLPSGTLLTLSPGNPRLEFFSPGLSLLGTAATNLHVSAVF